MKHLPLAATVAALAALQLPVLATTPAVVQLDSYATAPSGGEIVAHDKAGKLLYVTSGAQGTAAVEIVNAADPANLTQTGVIDVSSIAGLNSFSVSSVAADPLGRGFGVATFIPEKSGSNPGKVVFFDPVARTVLHSVDVGYHPDMVRFSADGTKLFVANEGEPMTEPGSQHFDRPGSLSVVDLTGIAAPAQVTGVTAAQVSTYDFSAANLAAGVGLDGLRVHPSNNSAAGRVNDAEPEYITQAGDKLYVSLQENNAVAEFDLAQGKWTQINPLGVIQQTIDASDQDGGIRIDDTVHGMPMPDGVASVQVGGKTYYLTANEGDGRPADRVGAGHPNGAADDPRARSLSGQMDPAYKAALDAQYGGQDALDNSRLGRLRVSAQDGDTSGDGKIDRLTMFGTRSFTIWDAETGLEIFDSGSDFEDITAAQVPLLFNSNGAAGTFDSRSPAKGPEPEGITTGQVGGELWAFIGLERVGGWMAYDITDPLNPDF
ncbi:MAG: choice-of-anchor I family protein, partial [Limisphaerales bacterium]